MADEVLSQNEIDSLLSSISSGEMDAEELKQEEKEQKVRVYDFKRALRFSKDQIRSLTQIHENYARLLTTYFSAQLRTHVDISVASVDQVPYEEFIRSVPKMTILNIYSARPLDGRVLMEVSPHVAYGMLDRVLGGKGCSINKIENLTEIETMLMSQLFEKAAVNLREAWSSISEIDPVLEEFEVNPQFLQMVSPNETVIVVSLNTTIGETSGMINICIPHFVLEPIIPNLTVHHRMQTTAKERDPEAYEKLTNNIQLANVDAKVLLGETTINLQQLLSLDSDDVIALHQSIEDPLLMEVNDRPKFYVQPGTHKNKLSVQVLKEWKRGDENE
ncbi:flagellar motor switch protein FliM [Lentibacillus juripiscarius]|uniref:Flagellar motor switch protein FliM n=1 Tax=Lentibacillus juripiscarius TaxID=257446 RepID=A0ABW5V3P4_9BACI